MIVMREYRRMTIGRDRYPDKTYRHEANRRMTDAATRTVFWRYQPDYFLSQRGCY